MRRGWLWLGAAYVLVITGGVLFHVAHFWGWLPFLAGMACVVMAEREVKGW